MPIKLENHLALLWHAERLLNGLLAMRTVVERESELATLGGASPQEALANIDLMARPDFLVAGLAEIKAELVFERMRYSEARVKEVKRQREWRARQRSSPGGEPRPSRGEDGE